MAKKIITSALPYVNNQPHLGNIIGSVLSGDIYSRFCKKNNEEVVYLCGTDEYGTAIEMAAFAQNKTPLQICEENRIVHKQIYDWFDISFDHFGFTTSKLHTENVQGIFKKIYNNNFFEENTIEQFFCDTCQIFLADRYVVGTCKYCNYTDAKGDQCDSCGHTYKSLDLSNPKCTLCNSLPSIKETNHLFFNLGVFKDQLKELYEKNNSYWSENGKNITKSWLNQELLSRCMTRDLKNNWGVQVPLKGFETKVFYVWFDAVIGYFTFLKELVNQDYNSWLKEGELIQFMGKDNVFFHTIILPSMIFATKEEYPIVKYLSATEYLLFENQKFSKSRGHGIFGLDLIDNSLGTSCLYRYYLTKIRPEKVDSNFSFKHFSNVIDADLNNNIGNLCNRVLKYIKNKCNRKIKLNELNSEEIHFKETINQIYKKYLENFSEIKLRDALEKVLEISKCCNEYLQSIVSKKLDMIQGFSFGFSVIVLIGQLLDPFIPISSDKLLKMCNMKKEKYSKEFNIIMNWEISEDIYPLFNKLDQDILDKLNNFKK